MGGWAEGGTFKFQITKGPQTTCLDIDRKPYPNGGVVSGEEIATVL